MTFGFEPIAPGTVITRIEDGSVEGRATLGARSVHLEARTREARRDEIIAMDAGDPTDVRVTYEYVRTGTYDRFHGDETEAHPVERRTYRVRRRGLSTDFSRSDGGALTEKETEKLRDDFGLDGGVSPIVESLRGRTVRIGDSIEDTLPRMGEVFPTGKMILVQRMRRGSRRIAVFALHMEGRMDGARFDLDGEAYVDVASAALLRVAATGKMKYRQDGARMRGQVSLNVRYDYAYPN